MPKRFIRRYLPDSHKIRDHKQLRWLGKILEDPNLLHLNRYSVSGAVSVGLFVALLPVPFQMIIAALLALLFRVNLIVSLIMVWISNPLTMGPIFYFTYLVGAWILQTPVQDLEFEFTAQWFLDEIELIWQPLLLGSLVAGVIFAFIGNIIVRLAWRMHVIRNWKARKLRKQQNL